MFLCFRTRNCHSAIYNKPKCIHTFSYIGSIIGERITNFELLFFGYSQEMSFCGPAKCALRPQSGNLLFRACSVEPRVVYFISLSTNSRIQYFVQPPQGMCDV